jgi:flavin-binding protein dodecin
MLAGMLLSSFDNLQNAIERREAATSARQAEDRLAVAEHIIQELRVILQNVRTFNVPEGRGLIIKTAPNTFDVTFPVPMRIPPNLTFFNLPDGATPEVTNKTNVGFTVKFYPPNIPVENFGMIASAEL